MRFTAAGFGVIMLHAVPLVYRGRGFFMRDPMSTGVSRALLMTGCGGRSADRRIAEKL